MFVLETTLTDILVCLINPASSFEIDFSTAVGKMIGSATLSGNPVVNLGITGLMTGVAVLSGNPLINISASGALVGSTVLAGDPVVSGGVNTDFVTTWETTTSDETITLPLNYGGTFNFLVDWGDGSDDTITAYNQSEKTHNYVTAGTHTVTISGTLPTWGFKNGGDKLKIKTVDNWGQIGLIDMSGGFQGCSKLTSSATDAGDFSNIIFNGLAIMFNGATLFNGDIGAWDVSSNTNFYQMFKDAAAFNKDISSWSMGLAISLNSMFLGASSFNQDIGGWDTSSATNMSSMLALGAAFNQDISSWNVSSVTNMSWMFFDATSFDQNLGSWNISNVTQFTGMFEGATLSTANYDSLLTGWEAQTVSQNESFHGGSSTYTLGSAAETSRTSLINDDGWTITDGGGV